MIALNNVRRVGAEQAGSITTSNGQIAYLAGSNQPDVLQLYFDDAIVFPGLINSHDHLDFNLFPQLGNRTYPNYTVWGKHLHATYADEIAAVTRIPVALRAQWGVYKNLLCGVTTVVNHGEKLLLTDSPIRVFERCQSLHSVGFEKKWKLKLNNPARAELPVAIHIGEGTDATASTEIDQLIHWNLLHRDLVGIHGVAMTPAQAKSFRALVWCPESNYFLLGQTARIASLQQQVPILFGTDSTLTGSWNIWEHLRLALETGMLSAQQLWLSLNAVAAQVWELNTGIIAPGYDADLVVARGRHITDDHSLLSNVNPEDLLLVMQRGQIHLFDEMLYSQLGGLNRAAFSKVAVGHSYKYVYGDVPGLVQSIRSIHPEAIFPIETDLTHA